MAKYLLLRCLWQNQTCHQISWMQFKLLKTKSEEESKSSACIFSGYLGWLEGNSAPKSSNSMSCKQTTLQVELFWKEEQHSCQIMLQNKQAQQSQNKKKHNIINNNNHNYDNGMAYCRLTKLGLITLRSTDSKQISQSFKEWNITCDFGLLRSSSKTVAILWAGPSNP